MPQLRAVLFDMDGTLVETESLWHEAEIQTMAFYGQPWTDEEQAFALGGPFDRVAAYMAEKSGRTEVELSDTMIEIIDRLMRKEPLAVQPGIASLYSEIRAAGIPVGLVTNSFRQLVDITLESTGMTFDVIVAGDEIPENKPHPMPYLNACTALGVEPADAIVLEDSTTGIESATAAGCAVVAIPLQVSVEPADRRLIVADATQLDLAALRSLVSDE